MASKGFILGQSPHIPVAPCELTRSLRGTLRVV
jgi:hypothetical protein